MSEQSTGRAHNVEKSNLFHVLNVPRFTYQHGQQAMPLFTGAVIHGQACEQAHVVVSSGAAKQESTSSPDSLSLSAALITDLEHSRN